MPSKTKLRGAFALIFSQAIRHFLIVEKYLIKKIKSNEGGGVCGHGTQVSARFWFMFIWIQVKFGNGHRFLVMTRLATVQ